METTPGGTDIPVEVTGCTTQTTIKQESLNLSW